MLPNTCWLARPILAGFDSAPTTGRRATRDAEHDIGLVMVDLDAAHEGADDLTLAEPVERV